MNKRDFLRFLPVSAAAIVVPSAVANTLTKPSCKTFSACHSPAPLDLVPATPGEYVINDYTHFQKEGPALSIGVGHEAPVMQMNVNKHNFSTAQFVERPDGYFDLVFSHAKSS